MRLGFETGDHVDSKLKRKILKSLNNLNREIKNIQGLMKKASTGRPTEYMYSPLDYMDLFENDYTLSYSKINSELAFLNENGFEDLIHENYFESLKDFYQYYNGKLGSYKSRREYITSLYSDMEKEIHEYIIKIKKIPSEPLPSAEEFIDENTYHEILKTIYETGKTFERLPAIYKDKSEEELRDHILSNLEARHRLSATGETFNKTGKTDIIIRNGVTTVFIAECKFWDGKKLYLDTISQLLKYLTWRDTKTAVVIFVKNKKISRVIEEIEKITTKHPNYVNYVNNETKSWYNYIFHINDDPGLKLNLTVLIFHIPEE